ncbi:MAG: hypothetical protein AAGN35_22875 [Bacteroidota bacterium]
MPLDTIIIDGDQVIFQSQMGLASVVVKPGEIAGSGKTTLNGTPVCVSGDEAQVAVAGCDYTTPIHAKPGKGTLKIHALAPDQLAALTASGGKAVIRQGILFDARFEVQVPAQDIKPVAAGGAPIPDAAPMYFGKGEFKSTNAKVKTT